MRITFKRFKKVLKQTEFHILFLCLSFIALTWPFLIISQDITQGVLFLYLIVCWFIIIVLLFLISNNVGPSKIEDMTKDT